MNLIKDILRSLTILILAILTFAWIEHHSFEQAQINLWIDQSGNYHEGQQPSK